MESDGEQSKANATAAVAPAASFGALKQIDAGVLSVGYAEAGSPDGAPVILLHGWPYDIHTYIDAAPMLAPRATGSSCLRSEATGQRAFCRLVPHETGSRRRSRST